MQAINPRNLPSLSTMPQPTPKYIYVEKPTIDQLTSMGWQYIEGSWDDPQVTDRENFKQVLISEAANRKAQKSYFTTVNDSRLQRTGSSRNYRRELGALCRVERR